MGCGVQGINPKAVLMHTGSGVAWAVSSTQHHLCRIGNAAQGRKRSLAILQWNGVGGIQPPHHTSLPIKVPSTHLVWVVKSVLILRVARGEPGQVPAVLHPLVGGQAVELDADGLWRVWGGARDEFLPTLMHMGQQRSKSVPAILAPGCMTKN